MSDDTQLQTAAPTPGRFLVETAIYFTIISGLVLVFDLPVAVLVSGVSLLAALVVQTVWSIFKKPKPAMGARLPHVLAGIYAGVGCVAGFLAIAVPLALWLNFGLDPEKNSAWMLDGSIAGANGVLVIAITVMALITLLIYFLPLAGLRRRGIISGSFVSFVRTDLTGFFHSPMIPGAAMFMALVGFLSSLATLLAVGLLVSQIFPEKHTGPMDVAALFPLVPLGLLASCMLMSIARPVLSRDPGRVNEIGSHFGHGAPGGRRRPTWQGLVTATASLVVVAAVVHPIHFGMVASLSVVEGIAPWSSINVAVDDWVTAENEKDRAGEDIAADLNRHGNWSAAAPGEGLAALLPGLKEELSYAADSKCVAEINAAPLDPAALAGIDWIGEDYAGRTLAYCLRVACPSPVAWDAPAPVLLSSSHPSRHYMWVEHIYLDVFAYGAAPEPGGFCTTDGKLTEEFQG